MAILRGFPPSNTISPSIRIVEKDLTYLTTTPTLHNVAVVGFASKGPINTPTIVTSPTDLQTVFGNPHTDDGDPYMIYAAQLALLVSSQVYVVRVADTDPTSISQATVASNAVAAAGGVIDVLGSVVGDYTFSDTQFFRWKLNGILNNKTLVVTAVSFPATFSAEELAADLNSQLNIAVDGIEFYAETNTLGVRSTWAYGVTSELEFLSVTDMMVGPNSEMGLGTDMTAATITGTADRYPDDAYHSAGEWDFAGITGLNLILVVDGTDNVNVDNIAQVIDLSLLEGNIYTNTTALVAAIELASDAAGVVFDVTGDSLVISTKTFGRNSKLAVKAASTIDGILGLSNVAAIGVSPNDGSSSTNGRINGTSNVGSDVCFTLAADSEGIEGNSTKVLIENDVAGGTFSMKVFSNGVSVESWGNLTKDSSSQYYVGTYLSLVSDYIRVIDNTLVLAPPANTTSSGIALSGGSDGIPTDADDADTLLIGSPVSFTGIFSLSEPEQVDIDLLAVPGHSSTRVVRAMLDMCANYRQDCLAIIDPPFGLTPQEVINWQNGAHHLNNEPLDSDFGALYWPWVKIRDNFNAQNIWVPPSGAVLATIARSDTLGFPWLAPAGYTRGIVPGVLDVYSKATSHERDLMYGYKNAVNPIVSFPDIASFVIWGQKTLQRMPSALDRINVRRLMFYIEKNIKLRAKSLLFEAHTDSLRKRFTDMADSVLTNVKINQGVYDYIIKCDAEINTADVIDRNEMRARIGVQPVRSAEFFFIEFSLHRTGTFNENTSIVS